MKKYCRTFLLFVTFLFIIRSGFSQSLNYTPKILLVTAHPDDDALFSATVFKTTRLLGGKVDLAVMTNGAGGYHYSTLADYMYGKKLDKESIGRQYLPAIRKRELMNGGKVVGIRNYFFFDQKDDHYSTDVSDPLKLWHVKWVKKHMENIVKKGNYDFIFTMLPTSKTHAHHQASAILTLQALKNIKPKNRPIILATTILRSKNDTTSFSERKGFPITKINKNVRPFTFDRTQTFGYHNKLNYKIIANWVIAAHKSQGTMQLLMNKGNIEEYLYYAINPPAKASKVRAFFKAVRKVPIYTHPNGGD